MRMFGETLVVGFFCIFLLVAATVDWGALPTHVEGFE